MARILRSDMLQVGKGKSSLNEWRTNFILWAIAKAPLLLSTNLTALAASHPSLLPLLTNSELIAINQDPAGESTTYSISGALLFSFT